MSLPFQLEVCKNGWPLPRQHYELVCGLSKDAAESVRLLGLRLIHIYASTAAYVDTLVVSGTNKNVEIRLIDHAFSALCNAMHDLSVTVRTEAATLLGTLKDVSEKFLQQTLDKKLMSNMRVSSPFDYPFGFFLTMRFLLVYQNFNFLEIEPATAKQFLGVGYRSQVRRRRACREG